MFLKMKAAVMAASSTLIDNAQCAKEDREFKEGLAWAVEQLEDGMDHYELEESLEMQDRYVSAVDVPLPVREWLSGAWAGLLEWRSLN